MAQSVTKINALELAQLLREGASDVIVVDVRDTDRAGGHIKGSINIHAHIFQEDPKKWATEWPAGSRVVFHCMFSQIRGPSCAALLAQANEELNLENPTVPYILVGGYRSFVSQGQFRDLVEGLH